jgi:hypothetical protein
MSEFIITTKEGGEVEVQKMATVFSGNTDEIAKEIAYLEEKIEDIDGHMADYQAQRDTLVAARDEQQRLLDAVTAEVAKKA